jgi:hypothetical protein
VGWAGFRRGNHPAQNFVCQVEKKNSFALADGVRRAEEVDFIHCNCDISSIDAIPIAYKTPGAGWHGFYHFS